MTVTRTTPARRTGGEKLTPLELGAWREFLHAHAVLTRELDEELRRSHGLPLSSYDVLVTLERAPDRHMPMSGVPAAALLLVTRARAPDRQRRVPAVADAGRLGGSGGPRLVERLEREGLLSRADCPDD